MSFFGTACLSMKVDLGSRGGQNARRHKTTHRNRFKHPEPGQILAGTTRNAGREGGRQREGGSRQRETESERAP